MGVVYRAQQERPRRQVALKLVRPGMLAPRYLRRFEYEAEVLGRLAHTGIARIYEAGLDTSLGQGILGQPFFAMELIEGERLDDYVQRAGASIEQRLLLITRVCAAVEYAHQKGVIHRDLKPGNILVTRDGEPKILDFGVARLVHAAGESAEQRITTDTGALIGTLAYMAPEQVLGHHEEVDTRADVYALGVISYELLTGRPPHDLADQPLPQAIRTVAEVEPLSLGRIDPALRGDLETIVAKAMAKDKTRRYASAGAFAEDIQRYVRSEPISARPLSTWYYLGKFTSRNKAMVAAVAVAFLLLLLGLAGTSFGLIHANWQRRQAEIEKMEAQLQKERAVADRAAIEETKDYLIDALFGADPHHAILDENPEHAVLGPPALELVEHAVADLRGRFDDRPLVKAELQCALGQMLHGLGRPLQALPLLEEAHSAYSHYLGPRSLESLECAHHLARVQALLRHPGARRLQAETWQALVEEVSPDHSLALSAQTDLAVSLRDSGRLEEAEELLRQVLADCRAKVGPSHQRTITLMVELGETLLLVGAPAEALKLAEDAARRSAEVMGAQHPQTLLAQSTLASASEALGRRQEALAMHEEVLSSTAIVLGELHPQTLVARERLAKSLTSAGRAKEAEPLYQLVLEGRRQVLGEKHPDTLRIAELLEAWGSRT